MKTALIVLAAGILTLGFTSPSIKAEQPAPAVQPAANATPALTEEALLKMVKDMGYVPQIEKTDKGNIYTLNIKRGTWTYIIDVSLSPSKTKLWFSGWLSELPKDQPIPADKLLDLLEGSWTHGPSHFRYHRAFRQLNIGLCLDNREITPVVLREQLEGFMNTMYNTEKLWNAKKWQAGEQVTVGKKGEETNKK